MAEIRDADTLPAEKAGAVWREPGRVQGPGEAVNVPIAELLLSISREFPVIRKGALTAGSHWLEADFPVVIISC